MYILIIFLGLFLVQAIKEVVMASVQAKNTATHVAAAQQTARAVAHGGLSDAEVADRYFLQVVLPPYIKARFGSDLRSFRPECYSGFMKKSEIKVFVYLLDGTSQVLTMAPNEFLTQDGGQLEKAAETRAQAWMREQRGWLTSVIDTARAEKSRREAQAYEVNRVIDTLQTKRRKKNRVDHKVAEDVHVKIPRELLYKCDDEDIKIIAQEIYESFGVDVSISAEGIEITV